MRQALLTVAAGLLLLAGCADTGEPSAEPTPYLPTPTTSSPTVTLTPTDSPSETVSPPVDPVDRLQPAVELDVPDDSTYLGRAGRLHVSSSTRGVLAQRPDGSVAWRIEAPQGMDRYDVEAWLLPTVGVVVMSVPTSMNPWPGRVLVRAVDARSGAPLWREDGASFANAGDGLVFNSFCTGRQDAVLGDCTLSARDARSGTTRWAVPTYASPMVDEFLPGAVVVDSYPGGGGSSKQLRSTATGATLSTSLAGFTVTAVDDGFLGIEATDRQPGNGCRGTAQGLDLAGNVLWTRSFAVGRDVLDKDECAELYGGKVGPTGPYTVFPFEGVMRVLDPASGRTLWAGERAEEARLIHRGVLVAVQTQNGYDQSSRGIDLRSGKELWTQDHDNNDADGVSWTSLGRNLLGTDENCYQECRAQVLRPRTGEPLLDLSGEHALTGPGWVATFTDDTYSGIQVFDLP